MTLPFTTCATKLNKILIVPRTISWCTTKAMTTTISENVIRLSSLAIPRYCCSSTSSLQQRHYLTQSFSSQQQRTVADKQRQSHLLSALLLCNNKSRNRSANTIDGCNRSDSRRKISFSSHSFNSFHRFKAVMDVPADIFRGSVDRFNGITVISRIEYDESIDFAKKLEKSLDYWMNNKRRGIWFNVSTEHAAWIPHLAKAGFDFHHAKDGFVVMYRWLPDESANIPKFCHTMLGVGGLVINEKNEVLVVSERYAMIPGSWKLPGGYVEPREDIVDAAIREVFEETGINSEFSTIVSMRHSHGGSFGSSDLYVVVGLTPKNLDFKRCEREIEELQWMPVDEYLQHPKVHETNRHFVRTFLDYRKRNIRFTSEKATHQVLKKDYFIYYMKALEESTPDKSLLCSDNKPDGGK